MFGNLRFTRCLLLIIIIDEERNMHVCIDRVHATHVDVNGHSGLYFTMGSSAMINVSKKLGVGAFSSAEAEVVSTGKIFPKCAWFRHFHIAQGDKDKEDVLTQDNESRVFSRKNHPFSLGKGSKHANVRCFFVVDKLEKKEV